MAIHWFMILTFALASHPSEAQSTEAEARAMEELADAVEEAVAEANANAAADAAEHQLALDDELATESLKEASVAFGDWFDCTNDSIGALILTSSEPADAVAAAAVDGCHSQARRTRGAIQFAWLASGLELAEAELLFERYRTDLVRIFAAHVVRRRAEYRGKLPVR